MDHPRSVMLTLTEAHTLPRAGCACPSCSDTSSAPASSRTSLSLDDWRRVIDEVAAWGACGVLLRGGEPFLYPGILDLIEHIDRRGLFTSIDTDATLLPAFAQDLVRIGQVHLTILLSGPPEIHDGVHGSPGAFRRTQQGLRALQAAEAELGRKLSKSIAFALSPATYRGLGHMADVARSLGISTVCVVPHPVVPQAVGEAYEREMASRLKCRGTSWRRFCHDGGGIDWCDLRRQIRRYRRSLSGVEDFPYLPLNEDEYRMWFESPDRPVRSTQCRNIDEVVDVGPDGEVNFCVDFPDYSLGNVRETSLARLWTGERAKKFRQVRRARPLPICHRCTARFMSGAVG